MIATSPTYRKSAPFDVSSDDLVLRISGSSRNGQIVRLKSSKCTIGSGPRCTLRLRAAGVAPLHCLLLRGPTGAIVRCWSPDTRLNHRAFSDAVLSPGDRLGVGPIELEVLGLGAASFVEKPKIKRDDARHGMDAELKKLEARLAELEAEQNALAEERRLLETERGEIQRGADDERKRLETRSAELETEQNALAVERDALAEERRLLETERDEIQRGADDERKRLETRSAELETEQNALAVERDALAEERRLLERQREQLAETPKPVQPETPSFEPSETPVAAEEFTSDKTQDAESPRFEEQSERAPIDLNEVFRRIGAKVELPEDEAPGPDPTTEKPVGKEDLLTAPSAKERDAEVAIAPSPSHQEHQEAEEESIDDYMGRLMQRIRGGAGEPSAPSPRVTSRAAEPSVVEPSNPSTPATSLIPESVGPSEALPRTKAPENRTDLTALRELANLSARSAIGQHSRKVLVQTIYSKLMVAGVGLAAGLSLLWIWKQYGAWEMTFYSALAAILVAIYWGVQYALLTGRLIIDKSGSIDLGRNISSRNISSVEPSPSASDAASDVAEQA